MNNMFKSIVFTVIGLTIFFSISWLFVSIIPYLLIGGLIIYLIVKVKRIFNSKKKSKATTYNVNEHSYEKSNVQADYYNKNEKVIDVDYKEID